MASVIISGGASAPQALRDPLRGIMPDWVLDSTRTGEALRAHELYHIMQRRSIPDFEQKFVQAALKTEREGLPPWENPYEKPAYEFEQRVKEMLSYQGYED